MHEKERGTCASMAALLRASAGVSAWGLSLSCIAGLALMLMLSRISLTCAMALGGTALLGVLERYFTLRLRFDESLFQSLARGDIISLGAMDLALNRLGLRSAKLQTERPLDERLRGTRQLLQRHTVVVACQSTMFLLALMTQDLP